MGEYSKITDVELYNFMVFKQAKVGFDETGILNFKGYNDSGKSTILRAVAVALMDMFKTKQAKFISFGEEYFRIVVSFDDGVSVIRDKYSNGQSLYELYKNGELVFTTKIGNKLGKVDGVPKIIQDYLGLCITDSVYFNYQSCVDRLPLVDSTGSENYNMLHEVLKIEEISRANRLINTDKNDLEAEIGLMEYNLQVNETALSKCFGVSEELVWELERLENEASVSYERDKDTKDLIEKFNKGTGYISIPEICKVSSGRFADCLSLIESSNKVINSISIPKVGVINLDRVKILETLGDLFERVNNSVDIPTVPTIDLGRAKDLEKLGGLVSALDSSKTLEIPVLEKIDLSFKDKVRELNYMFSIAERFANAVAEDLKIENEVATLREERDLVVTEASKLGLTFVKCSNCGTINEVGGN